MVLQPPKRSTRGGALSERGDVSQNFEELSTGENDEAGISAVDRPASSL
jgi:hypothetical protein